MASFIRRFSVKDEDDKVLSKARIKAKASLDKTAEEPPRKKDEFDSLLHSGETILLAMGPTTTTTGATGRTPVRVGKQQDGLENIMELMAPHEKYEEQRVTMSPKSHRRVLSNESLETVSKEPVSSIEGADAGASYLRKENLRLEKRIQELNSQLFKERSANAELSREVGEALAQLEKVQDQNMALVQSTQQSEPILSPTLLAPPASTLRSTSAHSESEWQKKYEELEARSNALSVKAVHTIQESKLRLTTLQRENLELKDQLREYQIQLQQRDIEKGRAMSLIPRLVEMVQKLQLEVGQEKQKRNLEKEFDDLTLQAKRVPNALP